MSSVSKIFKTQLQYSVSVKIWRAQNKFGILLCCAEAVGAHVTFPWLKDTLVGCGTAAEVSDLNSLSCGNHMPNQF